jgi:hypothetical protein
MRQSFSSSSKSVFLLRIVAAISYLFLFNLSCNAPRDNPFDPLNPVYDYGIIEGTVQTSSVPRTGVEDVNVLWQPENIITKTDANGQYKLNNIHTEDGNLIFYKEGFQSDTLIISWGTSKREFTQLYLNRIPVLDSSLIYSTVINQSQRYELYVKAWITDLDGYVDSVFVYNSELNIRKPLDNNFQATITQGELNVTDIEQIVGKDLLIVTKDKDGNEFTIGTCRIIRVIKDEVTGLVPANDTAITQQPINLQWTKFSAGYNFTYTVEVYTNEAQLVENKENLPSDSTSYYLSQTLPQGNYYWVIWITDKYQNRSRSRQATFHFQ